ncbi:16S rRNA (uracil(1498)-N(3))-methyltransferase [Neptuniibacter halophilus]|uniref:16S rRNA (uracil(1498)-N(3))-methyltransferase n=1 Tax=Neptuniibacter halophilus TaxID=651666 RepID=UPI0025729F2F|nr:16S rRNA (uracil(1498)-N(3))-methyltransferase [Neptuniibacter halophilus]
MNLILLFPSDFISPNRVKLRDRRFQHIRSIHQPEPGQELKVGLLEGEMGTGLVTDLNHESITLDVKLTDAPPQALPLNLILALPRPKMLKRILQTVATMGVKELYLINSYRVDKSYWGTPILDRQLEEQLHLGLEQAGDTRMPNVYLRKRFKPFVEDELPTISQNTRALVAHPYHAQSCPAAAATATTLAIGPEGGFIPYEVEKLQQCGFTPVHLGPRILRVETAVPALLSRLFPV